MFGRSLGSSVAVAKRMAGGLEGGPADPAMLQRLLNGEFGDFSNALDVQNLTASFKADVLGFYHAVDWTESWLRMLGAFHIIVWTLAVGLRHYDNVQMVLLLTILAVVYGAESLNRYAGEHWQDFAGQNYFDKRGVFISVVFSTPLLACAMFVLLNALRSASKLLVQVKRKEFKAEARKRKKEGGGAKKEE